MPSYVPAMCVHVPSPSAAAPVVPTSEAARPYAFLDRGTGALVARGGPQGTHVAGRDEVEIGWTVDPDRWGQGLATELGAASVAHAFGPLGLAEVVSFTLIENRASRRVMEKLGFAYEGETEYAGLPHVLYRLSAASARSTSSPVV